MVKKKSGAEAIKAAALEMAKTNIVGLVKGYIDSLHATIEEKVKRTERQVMQRLTSWFFFASGITFIALAMTFYFIEQLQIPKSFSFLTAGLILLVIGGAVRILRGNTNKR